MKCNYEVEGTCAHPTVLAEKQNSPCFVMVGKPCALYAPVPDDKLDDRRARDMVDKPEHYSRYGIETIDALKGTMSPEEFNGFLKGNAFKYLTRAGAKDDLEQDLHKVVWYAAFLYLMNGGTVEKLKKTCEYMEGRFAHGQR